jgi:CheY-like chemotaxis protein
METCRKKILVVEDDSLFLWSLESFLNREGYEVSPVQSGESALDIARSQSFDLIISDFQLPGLNGRELIRKIKSLQPATKAILISAHQLDEVETEKDSLLNAYLNKPIELGILKKLVDDLTHSLRGC